MLSKEYSGLGCEVTDLNNRLIATGYLDLVGDEAEVRDTSGNLPILGLNTMVKISVRNSKVGTWVMTGRVYISDRSFLRITELKNCTESEKRRFFRLAVDHSAALLLPSLGGRIARRQKVPVRLRDISLCGLQVETERHFDMGDQLTVSIAMNHNEEVELEVVVRRIIQRDGRPTCYGCELMELSAYAERQLCAFILRQQQEQIRRSRGD